MVKVLLMAAAAILAVFVVLAILGPILHFAFLIAIAAAIGFVAFRVGQRRSRN